MMRKVTSSSSLPENWSAMTPDQKRTWRLNYLQNSEGIEFISQEAKKAYQVRTKRLVDALNVTEPDRVPVNLPVGNLPYLLNGVNYRTATYDYIQAVEACRKFNEKYSADLEYFASPYIIPGRVMDLLDYQMYSWAGHGLPLSAGNVQFLESEYMKADEYNDLIRDPSDFWLRKYLPRVFGALEPIRSLAPLTSIVEVLNVNNFSVLASLEMEATLLKLVEVGREFRRMMQVTGPSAGDGPANGYPITYGAFAKAPFDTLGDTLRGTAAVMKDMYRRPDKVLEACDKIADLTINSVLKSPNFSRVFHVNYPLHKGADGWMSEKQFETFYWPYLKKVMNAFINEGLIQSMFAEGSFNTRLESVNEFPKGTVTWWFDRSDMFKAKKILGSNCCIQGNVPTSLTITGSPEDMKAYCRKLIEVCGQGGGYILAPGADAENPRLENLYAMMAAIKEYGVYRK